MKAGWKQSTVGEAFETVTGTTPKKSENALYGDHLGLVKPPELKDADVSSALCSDFLSEDGVRAARVAPRGAVLVGCIGNLGKLGITSEPIAFNQQINAILPQPQTATPRFVFYYCMSTMFRDALNARASGTTVSIVNKSKFNSIPIPLPPLEEQQRIVAILDEAFEGLERARENAEANLASARELFEGWSATAFGGTEPQGTCTLGDVCTIQSGAGFPKKHQGDAHGEFPFYKVSDMNLPGNESALLKAVNYISDDTRLGLGAKIFPEGAIVFPKVGGAILTNKKRVVSAEGCVDNNVMGLIPDAEKIEPEYLHELVRATNIYDMSNKANPPSITQGTVRDWPIHLPDRQKQTAIVAEAKRLRASVSHLADHYTTQTKYIDHLRQSLLAKAFAGELT